LFADDDFAALYPTRGRPAEVPWRLALLTVFQVVENLSERPAADAVRARLDWQASAAEGFAAGDFRVAWEQERMTCPEGRVSSGWSPAVDKGHHHVIKVKFSAKDGGACPSKGNCTRGTRRTVTIRPREPYEALGTARVRQATAEYKEEYGKRAGVEGTISQGVRTCGLRRSRYAGETKTHLQHLATAAAVNVLRIGDWLAEKPREQTRKSAFARLMTPPVAA